MAKWELLAPVVAIASLVSGLATPTESAAITVAYAAASQALAHRELGWRLMQRCLQDCAQLIGGVMLILGMALGQIFYGPIADRYGRRLPLFIGLGVYTVA